MNINKFAEEIEKSVRKRLGETYRTEIRELTKNNSVKRISLSICPSAENLSPNIYLESYYEQYSHGGSIEYIVDCILEQLHNSLKDKGNFNLETIQNFHPDHIIPTLVNFERNKEILETTPYTPWLDLAITYRIMIDFDNDTLSSVLINQTMLQAWGKTTEEIHEIAINNLERIFPSKLQKMSSILSELMDIPEEENELFDSNDTVSMYVLNNRSGMNGASNLLTSSKLTELANHLEKDLIILPSSIHESILLPFDDALSAKNLAEMVRDINEHEVSAEEVLSDQVYRYQWQSGEFCLL